MKIETIQLDWSVITDALQVRGVLPNVRIIAVVIANGQNITITYIEEEPNSDA